MLNPWLERVAVLGSKKSDGLVGPDRVVVVRRPGCGLIRLGATVRRPRAPGAAVRCRERIISGKRNGEVRFSDADEDENEGLEIMGGGQQQRL